MACEEQDFVMLDTQVGEEEGREENLHRQHQQQTFHTHINQNQTISHSHPQIPITDHTNNHIDPRVGINSAGGQRPAEEEDFSDAAFCSGAHTGCAGGFAADLEPHRNEDHEIEHDHGCFEEVAFRSAENENRCSKSRSRGKMKELSREELSDGGSTYWQKKRKNLSTEFKKDREEWSDSAIGCLLDAYTEKYLKLNRGNLRGRDWEEVANIVSERCDRQKSAKSIEQCKNKVDNLKKRYKSERQRVNSGSLSVSHWPWFKKMEVIVGPFQVKGFSDEDKSLCADGSSTSAARPAKKLAIFTPYSVGHSHNLKTKTLASPRWRRVLLKISGFALADNSQNVDPKVTMLIAREIAVVKRIGVEVAIVVGGRNFFCGSSWAGITGLDRASADQIGMMATVMNAIILQASLESLGIQTRVQTAFKMSEVAEPYIRRRAIRHLEKGRVVIFGAGTGNPFFTTDTAAALRASEINAEVVFKGTNVDGVYECDPRKGNNALLDHISYRDFVSRDLSAVMDLTAITLCDENCIPVVVFNLHGPGNISRALSGERIGTYIDQTGRIH